jgi:hypothetical protein
MCPQEQEQEQQEQQQSKTKHRPALNIRTNAGKKKFSRFSKKPPPQKKKKIASQSIF